MGSGWADPPLWFGSGQFSVGWKLGVNHIQFYYLSPAHNMICHSMKKKLCTKHKYEIITWFRYKDRILYQFPSYFHVQFSYSMIISKWNKTMWIYLVICAMTVRMCSFYEINILSSFHSLYLNIFLLETESFLVLLQHLEFSLLPLWCSPWTGFPAIWVPFITCTYWEGILDPRWGWSMPCMIAPPPRLMKTWCWSSSCCCWSSRDVSALTLKWLGHFFQNMISFSDAVHLMCNIFVWNW